MIRLEIELWLGLGEEQGGIFQILSPVRSRALMEVPSGTTVRELFTKLAKDDSLLAERVFDPEAGIFRPDVVLLKNETLVSRLSLAAEVLSNGDRIRIVPVYPGG